MKLLKAMENVLSEAGEPLHYREVTRRILDQSLWQTEGKTPESTVSSYFTNDTKYNGLNSLFQRIGEGIYALRAWGLSDYNEIMKDDDDSDNHISTSTLPSEVKATLSDMKTVPSNLKPLSFTDAAEEILKRFSGNKPMHYRDITQKAIELSLIKTSGLTPEATLSSQILTEIERQTNRGDTPRFVKHGKGFFGLTKWMPVGLVSQIEQQNSVARNRLHERLFMMSPKDFEILIGQLLVAIGFENIAVTKYSGDGGIDVRGTLVVGDVIRINMAVQVKRWKNNLQSPEVQKVRGSLGTHDQGLIITTGGFSSGAYEESNRSNAVPVALMDGEQLVSLLVKHNIGVHRTSYELIELGDTDE